MTTTTEPTTEKEQLLEILKVFCDPDHEALNRPYIEWSYRGNGTQSFDNTLKKMLGEGYEHIHWNTFVGGRNIALWIPRWKAPDLEEKKFRILTAGHRWALTQVEDESPEVSRAKPATINRVPVAVQCKLRNLPNLMFCEVSRVNYWESGKGPAKRKSKPAPKDVVYFKFDGGYGLYKD